MYNLNSEYYVGKGYEINHIPQIIPLNEFGAILFGEDPGNIADEVQYTDLIQKLTR